MPFARSGKLPRMALALALAVASVLPGCGTTSSARPQAELPEVPRPIRECFASTVTLPAASAWTSALTAETLAKVRASELSKTACGRRLLDLYDSIGG